MNPSVLEQLSAAAGMDDDRRVLSLSLEAIEPDPDQPRKTFHRLETLTASIRAIGIKQPLLVRPHPETSGRYQLVAGERRFRAARRAGLSTVPCLLEAGDACSPEQLLITQLSENLQRADVPILETAQALERALEVGDLSKQQLAQALGKKASFISKHLALLKAEGPAREALEEGLLLSTETFRLFCAQPLPRQRTLLARARRDQHPITRGQVSQTAHQRAGRVESASVKAEEPLSLRLSAEQLCRIIRRFDVEPPANRSDLASTLMSLLR